MDGAESDALLISRVTDKSQALSTRVEAAMAIGKPGISPQAIAALSKVLYDKTEHITMARAALHALLSAGEWSRAMYAGRLELRREALAAVTRTQWLNAQAEQRLLRDLEIARTRDHPLRSYTVTNAGATYGPDPRLIGVLEEVAADPDAGIRMQALHSLAVVGQIDRVIEGLGDPDESVRWYAAAALGNYGFAEEPEIAALRTAMEGDTSTRVRREATAALRKLGALKRSLSKPHRVPPPDDELGLVSILKTVSTERIRDPNFAAYLDDDVVAAGWLGRDGTSLAEIEEAERRLGLRLPPSYRQFLQITNGFEGLPASLSPVAEIGPLRDKDPETAAAWSRNVSPAPHDPRYEVYGPEQDPVWYNPAHLPGAIMIGPYEEFGCYLLNPNVVFEDGEWEAWNLNHDLPGANRYRSFRDLLAAEAGIADSS